MREGGGQPEIRWGRVRGGKEGVTSDQAGVRGGSRVRGRVNPGERWSAPLNDGGQGSEAEGGEARPPRAEDRCSFDSAAVPRPRWSPPQCTAPHARGVSTEGHPGRSGTSHEPMETRRRQAVPRCTFAPRSVAQPDMRAGWGVEGGGWRVGASRRRGCSTGGAAEKSGRGWAGSMGGQGAASVSYPVRGRQLGACSWLPWGGGPVVSHTKGERGGRGRCEGGRGRCASWQLFCEF